MLGITPGDNRYILDYLVEEVLQRQPERIRSFLLQTSILERLHGSLCNAVLVFRLLALIVAVGAAKAIGASSHASRPDTVW